MGRLFPNKWISREGDICDDDGVFTKNFLQWCRDLSSISNEQYASAFMLIEQRCADAEITGKDYWPPNYAGFKGLCRQRPEHKTFRRQLPYSRDERNRKGKIGISGIQKILSGRTIIPEEEADIIIEAASDEAMKEFYTKDGQVFPER